MGNLRKALHAHGPVQGSRRGLCAGREPRMVYHSGSESHGRPLDSPCLLGMTLAAGFVYVVQVAGVSDETRVGRIFFFRGRITPMAA
jgi:hypothetical protein